ncbi:MAG: methionine adenosyltransferase [Chromatiales bacterium]|jgi:S-adenosylmethionine synthetase
MTTTQNQTDFVFTSGAATAGHPDKLCDSISDAVVDQHLMQDETTRIITECAIAGGVIFVSNRSLSEANVDLADTARDVIAAAGYREGEFNAEDCTVMINQAGLPSYSFTRLSLQDMDSEQAATITAAHPVTLFGYACRQTASYMPLPLVLAHALAKQLDQQIAAGQLGFIAPDSQMQVSIAYRQRKPVAVQGVSVLLAATDPYADNLPDLRAAVHESVIKPVLSQAPVSSDHAEIRINPQGAFLVGGPLVHSGLTGRKTGMDSYGEFARQSGAALSGKDPLRIDRIGAYAARHAAKHVVAAGLADECEVLLSYGLGQAAPISVQVNSFGTGNIDEADIAQRLQRAFDFRPGMIARDYGLQSLPKQRGGFFRDLAVYGHYGRDELDLPWERLDRLEQIQS